MWFFRTESTGDASASGEKVFYYGDTTFNTENDETDVDPHNGYSGWACIRYGIGETLFRYSDSMELEPWLASGYENVDENTWRITLKDGIQFTSGRSLDAQAVKECLDHLVEVHARAKGDLKIKEITAEGMTLTITTSEPVPALMKLSGRSLWLYHRYGSGDHRGWKRIRDRPLYCH